MDIYSITKEAISLINKHRIMMGQASLSKQEEKVVRAFYEDKMKEFENSPQFKMLSDSNKRQLEKEVLGKIDSGFSGPVCYGGDKAMNDMEQINKFRGLGFDNIIEDGLKKGLSAGDIAINICQAMPSNRCIGQQRAINLLAEAGKKAMNRSKQENPQEDNNFSNLSDQEKAVNLLTSAAKRLRGEE